MHLVSCPSLSEPSNGMINCSLGDDGVLSHEDTCSFTCNTGYKLTGSESRTCQNDGSWSGSITMCNRGRYCNNKKLKFQKGNGPTIQTKNSVQELT